MNLYCWEGYSKSISVVKNDDLGNNLDISFRCNEEELKIYFQRTSPEQEKLCKIKKIHRCTLVEDEITAKIRILIMPVEQLAVHVRNSAEEFYGKQPLQFQHSYNEEADMLMLTFVDRVSLTFDSVKSYALIEDSLVIDRSKLGIVGIEFIGAKDLLDIL